MQPFVSVIIPAFNAEKTIAQCIESISSSSYPASKIEILVIDNGSTDQTATIVQKTNAIYFYEPQRGRSIARNRGIELSKGDYIAFLDADTYIDEAWIENMVHGLLRNDIGGGQGTIIPSTTDGRDQLNKYRYRSTLESTGGSFVLLDIICPESPMINSAACMYKKQVFDYVKGFDPFLERHEDIDLSKRVLFSGYNLKAIPEAIAYVHFHGEGWMDYFKRAFRHGFTKCAYWKKWNKLSHTPKGNSTPQKVDTAIKHQDINLIDYSKINGAIQISYVIKDFTRYLLSAIFKWDFYYLIKIAEQVCISTGRLAGQFQQSNNNATIYGYEVKDQSFEASLDGKTVAIKKYSRVVYTTSDTLIICTQEGRIHKFPKLLSIFIDRFFGETVSYDLHIIKALEQTQLINEIKQ